MENYSPMKKKLIGGLRALVKSLKEKKNMENLNTSEIALEEVNKAIGCKKKINS